MEQLVHALQTAIRSERRRQALGPDGAAHVQQHCAQRLAPPSKRQVTRQFGLAHVLRRMPKRDDEDLETRQLAASRMLKPFSECRRRKRLEALPQRWFELLPPVPNGRDGQVCVGELAGVISIDLSAE
jgi:hypothetical protein